MSRFANKIPHKVVADALNYKYVFAGRPKSGKTSLVYGIVKEKYDGDLSKLLLLAFERGYNALDGIYAEDITSWETFREVVTDLVKEKDEVPFKVLGLDTVDIMAKMATDYIIKTQSRKDGKRYTAIGDIGFGKGYELLDREMAEQIAKLDNAGYTLMYITHDKDKQFETREGLKYDKTTLSLSGRVRDLILNSVDFICFIELGKEMEKGQLVDKRYIYFRGDSGLEAGSRFEHVPNRIEYDFRGFIDTVEEAILAEYDGDKKAVEKAKKEQNAILEEKAKEFVQNEKEPITPSQLHSQIKSKIESLKESFTPQSKKELGAKFKELLGSADWTKSDDVEKLQEALAHLDTI